MHVGRVTGNVQEAIVTLCTRVCYIFFYDGCVFVNRTLGSATGVLVAPFTNGETKAM